MKPAMAMDPPLMTDPALTTDVAWWRAHAYRPRTSTTLGQAPLLELPATFTDVALVAAVGVFVYNTGVGSSGGGVVASLMTLALLVRRHFPMTVMLAVSALAIVQLWALPGIPTPYDVVIYIAMVSVVSHARHAASVYLSLAIVLGGVGLVYLAQVGAIDQSTHRITENAGDDALFTGGISIGVWLFAYTLRTRKMLALQLAERAATAQRERDHLARLAVAKERAAIARELHDVVAHNMSVMILQADGATFALDSDLERARSAMRHVAATGRDALDDMRRIVGLLRGGDHAETVAQRSPIGLDQLEPLAEQARTAGMAVELSIGGDRPDLSAAEELTIFRLVQEGLTNALRHAGPKAAVTVSLVFGDRTAAIDIVDDGAGRAAADAVPAAGLSGGNGLIGMRERVAVHGGTFESGPRSGAGWQIRATLPVKGASG